MPNSENKKITKDPGQCITCPFKLLQPVEVVAGAEVLVSRPLAVVELAAVVARGKRGEGEEDDGEEEEGKRTHRRLLGKVFLFNSINY